MKLWKQLLKDVLLTGTGVVVILLQAFSTHPYPYLILAGLALTVPSVADHVRSLLPGGESSSSSSQPRGSSPPSPPTGVSGE